MTAELFVVDEHPFRRDGHSLVMRLCRPLLAPYLCPLGVCRFGREPWG